MTKFHTIVAMIAALLSSAAFADTTLTYRSDGGCAGDFDRFELKSTSMRVDGGRANGSMIYDHAEKLAYFIDHRSHSFMQSELDEDAVDLQGDIMKSLRTRMRREGGGVDPFEMAQSLCPGLANAASRDRQPGGAIDCGNGVALGGGNGANGKPMSRDEMVSAMQSGRMPDANTQQMMQKMMEQQMAKMTPEQRAQMQKMLAGSGSGASMPMMLGAPGHEGAATNAAPAPQRIDRDAGEIEVDGITCLRREHLSGEEMLREDCYAPAAALHLADVETRRIGRFTQSIRAWSRSFVPEGMQGASDDRVLVRRVCYAGGHESGRATIAIDHATIDAARFEVPAGYKPMDLGFGGTHNRGSD